MTGGIGVLGEKPLHADLKRRYTEPGDRVEVPMDGFVIDIVRPDRLVEIQTRGFSGMKRKLTCLLDSHAITVVHPIAAQKWILKVDDDGQVLSRRKSPKKGSAVDIFGELVSFPDLMTHPNLTLEVLLTSEQEVRRFDAKRAWRRHGWVVEERQLLDVSESFVFASVDSLIGLLPTGLPTEFTTASLAGALGRPRRLAQQMTYCLSRLGAIERVGKDRNAVVYGRSRASGTN